MNEPKWITKDILLAVHAELLNRFGGLSGTRDEGLLDSAINRPKHLLSYGSPTLFQMAASYAHGIVKNHPFLDGNKRTGFMSAYIFLGVNGWSLQAPEEEAVLETLALAAGETSEEAYAAWLERTSVSAN
ncbi:MAG: death-on-curing protein [Spartobacteria bacterium AMD-G4]|jgi:death-on-curing protein|nr:MAG: death-on-curing protein [Spartobacteria bacterium AMD-G4]